VAISGNTAVVGSNHYQQGASAYVFVRSGKTWSQQVELNSSDEAANDYFSYSVAISGTTAIVGAPGKNVSSGVAYVFVLSGTNWTQQAELTASDAARNDAFGWSLAISGSTAVVGAPGHNSFAGAAYVFTQTGVTWAEQAELTASDGVASDRFGWSVANSGSIAIVGAYLKNSYSGAAYVFMRSGTAWTQQAELTPSDGASDDFFGESVAISGTTAMVGAFGKNSYSGAAYVFARSGTSWPQQAELSASNGALDAEFGFSVAVSGTTAVVGANHGNSARGAAYVFVQSGTAWTQQDQLTASDGAAYDMFGSSVAVRGSTVIVGAPDKNSLTGAAYVFVIP
jgi:hypothetical protein